jgi:hypothetical protein
MKCIAIAQPWAWAILAGLEIYDYRSHGTDYRGELLIYASPRAGCWEREQLALYGAGVPRWEDLPQGMVVGRVELWACGMGEQGEWVWALRNPRFIKPVFAPPGKGLYDVNIRRICVLPPSSQRRVTRSP